MPKNSVTAATKLRRYTREHQGIFTTDDKVLFCVLCEKSVDAKRKSQVDQHLATALHKKRATEKDSSPASQSSAKQTLIGNQLAAASKVSNFSFDLCCAMLSADIPLHKLRNKTFKKFLETYTKQHIPSVTTLRTNYTPMVYEEFKECVRKEFSGKDIWLAVDETTDSCGRCTVNVVGGVLDGKVHTPPYRLIYTAFHDHVNHCVIAKDVTDALQLIWPEKILYENLLLLLTDGAAYMVKCGQGLKLLFTNMIHLTCLNHALHRLCELIRESFPNVDCLIVAVKKIFAKSSTRIRRFRELYPNLNLPPKPVLTRWGTWLSAAVYYAENWDSLKAIVNEFDDADSKAIETAKDLFKNSNMKHDLAYIHTHFSFLGTTITTLETSNVPLVDSLREIENVKVSLKNSVGEKAKNVSRKLQTLLDKNPGYTKICQIASLHCGENTGTDVALSYSPLRISNFAFAPITSCDVERSFSRFKAIFRDNRQTFTEENLAKLLFVNCNSEIAFQ